jgi:hypothetical protein
MFFISLDCLVWIVHDCSLVKIVFCIWRLTTKTELFSPGILHLCPNPRNSPQEFYTFVPEAAEPMGNLHPRHPPPNVHCRCRGTSTVDAAERPLWMPRNVHCGCRGTFTVDAAERSLWMPRNVHCGCRGTSTVDAAERSLDAAERPRNHYWAWNKDSTSEIARLLQPSVFNER